MVNRQEKSSDQTADSKVDYAYSELGPAKHEVTHFQSRETDTTTTTTEGSYGPFGGSEKTAVTRDFEERSNADYDTDYRDSDVHFYMRVRDSLVIHVTPSSVAGHGRHFVDALVTPDPGVPHHIDDPIDPFEEQQPNPPISSRSKNEKPQAARSLNLGVSATRVETESPFWAGAKAFGWEFGYQSGNFLADETPILKQVKGGAEIVRGKDIRGDDIGFWGYIGAGLNMIPGSGVAKKSIEGTVIVGKGAVKAGGYAFDAARGLLGFGKRADAATQVLQQAKHLPAQLDEVVKQADKLDDAVPDSAAFAKPKSTGEVGEYSRVGGHHVHAKAAFKDSVLYDKSKGFSISQDYMRGRGWDHQAMTNKQRELFDELAASGRPNTLTEHTRIAVEALVAGGAKREEARSLVAESLLNIREQGVRAPTHIPWN